MNIFKYITDYAQLSIYKKTGKYASVSCDIKYKPLNEDNIRFDITFFICFPGYPKIAKGFIYIGEDIDVLDENFIKKIDIIADEYSLYFNSVKDVEDA